MPELRITLQFIRATKKADRRALEEARDDILADPYHARGSHVLSYEWAGFRAAEFDGKHRIIYRICEECRAKRQAENHPLDCCSDEEKEPDFITFVDFGDYHKSAGRRRLTPSDHYGFPSDE